MDWDGDLGRGGFENTKKVNGSSYLYVYQHWEMSWDHVRKMI